MHENVMQSHRLYSGFIYTIKMAEGPGEMTQWVNNLQEERTDFQIPDIHPADGHGIIQHMGGRDRETWSKLTS